MWFVMIVQPGHALGLLLVALKGRRVNRRNLCPIKMSKIVVEEVVHLADDVNDGTTKPSCVTKSVDSYTTLTVEHHSRSGKEMVVPKLRESGGPSGTRPEDEQANTCAVLAPQTAGMPCELPECLENTAGQELPNCAAVTEHEAFGPMGEGELQMDEEDVSRRLARHRRGRSMEDAPTIILLRQIVGRRSPHPKVLYRVREQHHLDFLVIMEPMISLEGRFMARRLGFQE
ncbi:UNVERIFIED_CONTAM: hypothetical protein Sindi_0047800, partial [Sesamum indicum]